MSLTRDLVTASPPDPSNSRGYAPESLEAAIWSFLTTDNFRDAILAATNLGEDADTTAAITGQLAGAFFGADGIPRQWRDKLFMGGRIETIVKDLYELSLELTVGSPGRVGENSVPNPNPN